MAHTPVKLAVIGCSGYSEMQIKRILAAPESATLVAVTAVDLNCPIAQQCCELGISVFGTVDELINYGQFEAVVNPTPIHLHARFSMQCIAAGFPVFMEKPPTATVQELDRLSAAAHAAGLPVAVCFNQLYTPVVQQLKRDLLSGRYGKVLRVKGIGAWIRTNEYYSRSSWAGKVRQDGNWVLDGTINNPFSHVLCNNLFFAAGEQNALAEPVEVTAELYRCNAIESEDTSCVRVMTREGVEVMTWFTLGSETELPATTVIETEKAVITFENFQKLKIEFADGRVEVLDNGPTDKTETIRQLCRALRAGERFCCSLDMSRPFTVVVNAAFDSSGRIHVISGSCRKQIQVNDAVQMTIPGVVDCMRKAFEMNALFSEIGTPWAQKGETVNTENYAGFPVRFNASGKRQRLEPVGIR